MIIEGICAFLIIVLGALDIKSGLTKKGVIEICGAVVWFGLCGMMY